MTDIELSIRVPSRRDALCPTQAGRFSKNRYGRIPAEVLTSAELSHSSIRLYGIMAMYVYEGNVVTLGMRKIANMMHVGRSTVSRLLQTLVKAGFVKANPKKAGKRAFYELTSPVFAQKQGKVNVIRSGPRGSRLVSVEKTG
jgi:DNA-binding transcriptional ArsR family regulator